MNIDNDGEVIRMTAKKGITADCVETIQHSFITYFCIKTLGYKRATIPVIAPGISSAFGIQMNEGIKVGPVSEVRTRSI